jgi:hypothetical protein
MDRLGLHPGGHFGLAFRSGGRVALQGIFEASTQGDGAIRGEFPKGSELN